MSSFPDDATYQTLEADGCAPEAMHTNDSVQSHGLLLALSEPDLIVRHASANALDIVGLSAEELLNRSVEVLLGPPQVAGLRLRLLAEDVLAANPYRVVAGSRAEEFNCIAHRQGQWLILEFEPISLSPRLNPINVAANLQASLYRMTRAPDVFRLADVAASDIRRVSGFDRVIIYRFAESWEGEVIADAASASTVSCVNLRFPASDTPEQARRMFLVNRLRLIADANSLPVPILPFARADGGQALDLTHSTLRSALPGHIAYIRKLDMRAAMTLSIVVQSKLWGMIVCYHGEPLQPSYDMRVTCDLICQLFASQVVSHTETVELQARLRSRDEIEAYMTGIDNGMPIEVRAIANERLLNLLDGDGIFARSGDAVIAHGMVIDEARFRPLLAKLRARSTRGIADCNLLSGLDPAAEAFRSEASGALYLGLSETTEDYVVLFRRELISTIAWEGAPSQAAQAEDAPDIVQARTAFTAWQETARGRCRPWTELEVSNARLLREQFLRVQEAHARRSAEERIRYLAHYDPLTGIANRTSIYDRLQGCLSQAAADRSQLAALFIDLDNFKTYNDTFGHATGDRILQIVAARMQHNVRREDLVGRLGGDEFIVIMPGVVSEEQAIAAANSLLASIASPIQLDHGTARITASIGISHYPSDATDLEALLKHSDAAMYDAKRNGRNAAEVYSG